MVAVYTAVYNFLLCQLQSFFRHTPLTTGQYFENWLHMFNNFKIVYIFLVICALSSNNIIIYNEELLVALSFFLFVAFVARYYGNTLKDSLDSSSQGIREICENLTNSKQQYLQQLSRELERSVKYKSVFSALKLATNKGVTSTTVLEEQLASHFYQQTNLQCATLVELQDSSKPVLVHTMAKNQMQLVLTNFAKKGQNSGKLDPKLLNNVIGVMTRKG